MPDATDFILKASEVRFARTRDGHIVMHVGGALHRVGNVTAACPLTEPDRMVAVRDEDGVELGILDDIRRLDPVSQDLIAQELERSYFMPRITDILDIREDLGVETWEVETDRGPRTFHVRNIRQNVRKMGRRRLVIKDVDGNRYEIRDWTELPGPTEKLLQPYL